ncbi:HsdM family class I SAM-dependent methyltransferase [Mesomycoplasma molare]|uniref:site-specific DNA-methyltransferase (adenine-specific) n=1 Tax=Mesomycoplasma molare TaxID=171288 RepID=A0ABY5TY40_9BACT|nr:class I SAM-dependent DNA methyltransferase [Mesomycoplasma molare]UWD34431.1 type I restriction-modification system subunit M [Mesomycoplasma molare]
MNVMVKDKTIKLIDELKAVCQVFGLGNDGNEYKIITQIFLYKFINDKFGYEIKKVSENIRNAKRWDEIYFNMNKTDREELLLQLEPEIPKLEPEHLISTLWNQQDKDDFSTIFDNAMMDISRKNEDIFVTKTSQGTKIPIFEELTIYITDRNERSNFAKALISRLHNFSFEEVFEEKYDFFSTIFEYLIKDYNTNGGGKYAEYYTPHSIASIMAKLLVGKEKELKSVRIYDPSAGTGTLLMSLANEIGNENCSIFAQDISQRSNKMLKLNLILNGATFSLENIIQGDTLTSPNDLWFNKTELIKEFDFVVSNPPFKMDFSETREKLSSMPTRFWAGVPKIPAKKKESMAIYTLFIQHVINSIKSNSGKGAIVIPTGFITSKSGVERKILEKIVDDKLVYGCISMPSNVFANTGTNVSVLFFDKRKIHDKVILIDASKLGEEYQEGKNKKKRLTNDDIDLIIKTFNDKEVVDNFSVLVTYDEIKEKNYSLSAGQYFEIKIDYIDMSEEEFENKMSEYKNELLSLFEEGDKLQKEIMEQLGKIKYEKK